MALQWTYIDNTDKKYILTSTGKVFSAEKCDYLKPFEVNFFYRVYIKYTNVDKAIQVSIRSLLEKYFPESLTHKEYYYNVVGDKLIYVLQELFDNEIFTTGEVIKMIENTKDNTPKYFNKEDSELLIELIDNSENMNGGK